MSTVHVCWSRWSRREVVEQHCPTCKGERPMLMQFEVWYGWYTTCLGCGERWGDGERLPRPFAPGWRKHSIQRALAQLNAPLAPDDEFPETVRQA